MFNTSVNKIVSVFHTLIAKLESHAEAKTAEIAQHSATIATATEAINAAGEEAAKAQAVADKLKALV